MEEIKRLDARRVRNFRDSTVQRCLGKARRVELRFIDGAAGVREAAAAFRDAEPKSGGWIDALLAIGRLEDHMDDLLGRPCRFESRAEDERISADLSDFARRGLATDCMDLANMVELIKASGTDVSTVRDFAAALLQPGDKPGDALLHFQLGKFRDQMQDAIAVATAAAARAFTS